MNLFASLEVPVFIQPPVVGMHMHTILYIHICIQEGDPWSLLKHDVLYLPVFRQYSVQDIHTNPHLSKC